MSKVVSLSTKTAYIQTCQHLRPEITGSIGSSIVWVEKVDETKKTFVGFTQIFSDETSTTINIIAFLAYPVRVMFLNISDRRRKLLEINANTLIGFISVCCSENYWKL